jgi:hypothetical protein
MPPSGGGDSSFYLCAPEPVHLRGGHSISENAPPNSSVYCVSPMCIRDSFIYIHFLSGHSTLQKFDSCLRAQRELGTIKRLFKQSEITAQLDSCETELKAALGIFTVGHYVNANQPVKLTLTFKDGTRGRDCCGHC